MKVIKNTLLIFRKRTSVLAAAAVACGIPCLLAGQPAHAALLASESFNYTAASGLANQTITGAGFTGKWTPWSSGNGDTVLAGSLSEGGLATSANSLSVTGYPPVYGTLATAISAATATAPVWASFLYNPGAGTYYGGFTLNLNDTNNQGLAFGVNDNPSTHNQQFTVLTGSVSAVAAAAPAVNNTYLLVMEDVATASGGTLNLYVNPTVGALSAPAAPDATVNYTKAIGNITSLTLYGLSSSPVKIDEIRIGNTYADVTPAAAAAPEPASLALLGAGALGLLLIGRKRSTT